MQSKRGTRVANPTTQLANPDKFDFIIYELSWELHLFFFSFFLSVFMLIIFTLTIDR